MPKIHKNHPFGTVPNSLLNNPEISLKAKGLYAFMDSKPGDWEFTRKGLVSQLKESFDAIDGALSELKKHGYLKIKSFQNEKGHWDSDYFLYFDPELSAEEPVVDYPVSVKPVTDYPVSENPPTYKERITKKEKEINNKDIKKENEKFDAEKYVESLDLDEEVKQNLLDHVEVRKTKRAPTTQKAIDLILEKLSSHDKETKIKMLQNAVMGGWTTIYEITPKFTFNSNRPAIVDPTKKAPGEKVGYADYY